MIRKTWIDDERFPKGRRLKVELFCDGPTKTLQAPKKECDINNILEKYRKTGVIPEMRKTVQANFDDFSNIPEYKDALQTVINAREAFNSLDARTRKRFGNDPFELVKFCQNKDNYDEAVKLGLAVPREPEVKETKPQSKQGVKENPSLEGDKQ